MAVIQVFEGDEYPEMVSGDVWEFQGGSFRGLLVRGVVEMQFVRAPGAPECVFRPVDVPGEDSAWCRVMDGCRGTVLDGLEGTGGYHGIRLTGSRDCRVLRCSSYGNRFEGLIAGLTDSLEVGWCRFTSNGQGNQSRDKAHGCYVSEKSVDVWIHDVGASLNMGSGLQLNGTPEVGGVLLRPRVERVQLLGNGGSRTSTPNLSLISVQEGTFDQVTTQAGQGGMRCFTYGDGVSCVDNRFLGCGFLELDAGYSCEFLDGTRDTTFDSGCRVEGPPMRADESSELPRWV